MPRIWLEKRDEDMADAAERLARARFKSKEQFERRFARKLSSRIFEHGDLVLVRNTQVEKELDRKTKPRYLGPFKVVRRTQGGSYVIQELDGAISRRGIAAFRLIPYIARDATRLQAVMEGVLDDKEDSTDSGESDSNEEQAGSDATNDD